MSMKAIMWLSIAMITAEKPLLFSHFILPYSFICVIFYNLFFERNASLAGNNIGRWFVERHMA